MLKRTKKDGGGEPTGCRNIAGSWSDVSPEILSIIGKHLESRIDICKFRSVCKQWRSSLPLPKNPNFLTPFFPRQIPNPVSLPFNKQRYDSLDLVPITVFLVKPINCQLECLPANGWILSVEERQPGKLRLLCPLSRIPISSVSGNSPETLNFSQFRVFEVGKGYCFRSCDESISDCKVIVYSNSAEQLSANATDFTALVLYSLGELFGVRLIDGVWEFERVNSILWFKDVICFKGAVYAVAGCGKLYVVDHLKFRVTQTVVDDFVCDVHSSMQLVESCQELLLVVKDCCKVYRLNEVQHKWEAVQTLGDRVLFLGADYCFLISTGELLRQKGNFVVSSSSLNSIRSKSLEVGKNVGVHISCLEDVGKKLLKASFKAFTWMLQPPRSWFSPEKFLPSRSPSEERVVSDLAIDNHAEHLHGKDLEPVSPETGAVAIFKTPQMQPSQNDSSSMMKFHGLGVRSDFLPILEKVWLKHGDVVEGSSIRSCDTIAMALESLAKMVIILQANTEKTLTDDQASYLVSTLSDLQLMHLKVDWLVPFVEKALALHKSMQLEAILVGIDKALVKAQEMEHKFLEMIAQVKQGLGKNRKIVSDSMLLFGPTDWDQCLGEGLC